MKKTIIIFIVTIVLALVLFNLFMFKEDIFYRPNDNLEVVDIKNFKGIENLKLTGEVYEVLNDIGNYHGMGIVRVNIIETNMDYYDPRDNQANYYCIIKNGKAEIYINNLSKVMVGDTISINISEEITIVYNIETGKNRRMGTRVYPRSFFDFIKRKGYQQI